MPIVARLCLFSLQMILRLCTEHSLLFAVRMTSLVIRVTCVTGSVELRQYVLLQVPACTD